MPQGPQYIFGVQDELYNWWKQKPDGSINVDSLPYLMEFSPTGWNDIAIQNIRNKLYKSVDRTVTLPLGYIMDAAHILKYIFYKKGNNKKTFITIGSQRLDFEANPNGILAFTSGGSPFAPNTTSTGTITGTPGTTVLIRFSFLNPLAGDTITGDFDGVAFSIDYLASPPTFTLVIPVGGVINFNITFTQIVGSVATAGMALVNSAGNTTGSFGYWHKMIFRAEIDWATYDHTGPTVTLTTLEDGLPKYLKANDKTVYEYPMNVPEALFVRVDGIKMHEKLNYVDSAGFDLSLAFDGNNFLGPCIFINQDGNSSGVSVDTEDLANVTGVSFPDKVASLDDIIYNGNTYPITFNIAGRIEYNCTGMTSAPAYATKFRYLKTNQAIADQNLYQIISTPAMVVGNLYGANFSLNITLQPGERLLREGIFFGGPGSDAKIAFTDNSKFSITFISRYKPTYVRVFRPQYLFQLLVNSITEGKFTAEISQYFSDNDDKVMTCGNAIRGLDNATMKISFDMFFRFWNSLDSVGIIDRQGIKVGFEKEVDLIDFSNIIHLPAPSANSFKVNMEKEALINQVDIGFPKISNDVGELNANDEVCCGQVYSTETTNVSGKLDRISPVKVSPYEIEAIRISIVGKDSTAYPTDNDVYAMHIEDNLIVGTDGNPDSYNLDRTLNALVTAGLQEPESIFNLWFTPHRSFLRMGSHIHGLFFLSDFLNFIFRSADKNSALICDGIVENSNINIGNLDPALGVPVIFNAQMPIPEDVITMLELNPLQVFDFPFNGDIYIGILDKVSAAPSSKALQQIILRCAAVNNLAALIDYIG